MGGIGTAGSDEVTKAECQNGTDGLKMGQENGAEIGQEAGIENQIVNININNQLSFAQLADGFGNNLNICYKYEWKYFSELIGEEEVLTLNQETGQEEWQKPTDYQQYEHNGEMYKILLENSEELLVSPEHRVYAAEKVEEKELVSFIMMAEFSKNDSISLNFEHKDETSNMNSLVIFKASPKIFKMLDGGFVKRSDLIYLFLNSSEKSSIFSFELLKNLFNETGINVHELHQSLNSFKVFGLILPDFKSLATFSTDSTTSLITDSLTSLISSSEISDISLIFLINSSFLTSSNVLANAFLATDDQLIKSVSSISLFNSSGTDNVIVPIFDIKGNFLYYLNTKDIFKPFGLNFSLNPITDAYNNISQGKDIYFLDSENRPIKVLSIEKQPYQGKIYDVDVPNDIVLVRRLTGVERGQEGQENWENGVEPSQTSQTYQNQPSQNPQSQAPDENGNELANNNLNDININNQNININNAQLSYENGLGNAEIGFENSNEAGIQPGFGTGLLEVSEPAIQKGGIGTRRF